MIQTIDSFIVEKPLRVDKLLAEHYEGHSRSYFHFLIEGGHVLCLGKRVKKRAILPIGAQVEVTFIETPTLEATPEAIDLDILYEDEHILAINKPAGMVVHPAPGHPGKTFVNALLHHCQLDPALQEDTLRPGIVHRLDKDTSGVLLAAKTRQAHQKLIEMFSSRSIKKTYLAVALGKVTSQKVRSFIKRHPKNRQKMASSPTEGKEAITDFTLLAFAEPFSLVECDLLTGRTHQIRVHLSSLHFPIIGDEIYGSLPVNKNYAAPRQLLHAYTLAFNHPISNKPLHITAPVPEDIKNWTKKHNLQATCL